MIRMRVFQRPEFSAPPIETRHLSVPEALYELVSRLFWQTLIHEYSEDRLVIKCPDADPMEFVVFEEANEPGFTKLENGSIQVEENLEPLLRVAEWYIEATKQCSDPVKKIFEVNPRGEKVFSEE